MWELCTHEKVRGPTYMRGSRIKSKNSVYVAFRAKDEVRYLGASKGHCRTIRASV